VQIEPLAERLGVFARRGVRLLATPAGCRDTSMRSMTEAKTVRLQVSSRSAHAARSSAPEGRRVWTRERVALARAARSASRRSRILLRRLRYSAFVISSASYSSSTRSSRRSPSEMLFRSDCSASSMSSEVADMAARRAGESARVKSCSRTYRSSWLILIRMLPQPPVASSLQTNDGRRTRSP